MNNLSPALTQYINRQGVIKRPDFTPNPGTNAALVQKPDVIISSDSVKKAEEKKILKKISAGIALVSMAAALMIQGVKTGKIISQKNNAKKLAESIKFESANTIEEAIKFGKEKLCVKQYKGFKNSDLDILNWINEALVEVNNINHGRIVTPRIIENTSNIKKYWGAINPLGHLLISKDVVKNKAVPKIMADIKSETKLRKIVELSDSDIEKLIQNGLSDKYPLTLENLSKIYFKNVIYHEMGHLEHFYNKPFLYPSLRKKSLIPKLFRMSTPAKLTKFFKSKTYIAREVSNYAASSPIEFVAECYPILIKEKLFNKKLLSDEAFELYKKFGGAVIN